MFDLRRVDGRIRELGNVRILPSSSSYSNVIIDTADDEVAHVKNALVGSDMPNALDIGTNGTFWFMKTMFGGRTLVAIKSGGEFRSIRSISYIPIAIFFLFFSVPLGMFLPPFFMLALVGLLVLYSGFRVNRQLRSLKRRYAADATVHVRRVRMV